MCVCKQQTSCYKNIDTHGTANVYAPSISPFCNHNFNTIYNTQTKSPQSYQSIPPFAFFRPPPQNQITFVRFVFFFAIEFSMAIIAVKFVKWFRISIATQNFWIVKILRSFFMKCLRVLLFGEKCEQRIRARTFERKARFANSSITIKSKILLKQMKYSQNEWDQECLWKILVDASKQNKEKRNRKKSKNNFNINEYLAWPLKRTSHNQHNPTLHHPTSDTFDVG